MKKRDIYAEVLEGIKLMHGDAVLPRQRHLRQLVQDARQVKSHSVSNLTRAALAIETIRDGSFAALGHGSFAEFCRRVLQLSERTVLDRIRLAQRLTRVDTKCQIKTIRKPGVAYAILASDLPRLDKLWLLKREATIAHWRLARAQDAAEFLKEERRWNKRIDRRSWS